MGVAPWMVGLDIELGSGLRRIIFNVSNECVFNVLTDSISKLEKRDLCLTESIRIINRVISKFKSFSSTFPLTEFESILNNNPGFVKLKNISGILDLTSPPNCVSEFDDQEIKSFFFAPTTNCDVERSFSMYKHYFRANRHSFLEHNLLRNFYLYSNLKIINK